MNDERRLVGSRGRRKRAGLSHADKARGGQGVVCDVVRDECEPQALSSAGGSKRRIKVGRTLRERHCRSGIRRRRNLNDVTEVGGDPPSALCKAVRMGTDALDGLECHRLSRNELERDGNDDFLNDPQRRAFGQGVESGGDAAFNGVLDGDDGVIGLTFTDRGQSGRNVDHRNCFDVEPAGHRP